MSVMLGCGIMTIFLVVMLAIIIVLTYKKDDHRSRSFAKYGSIAVTVIYCATMSWLGLLYFGSMTHGNQDPWMDIGTMAKYTAKTPAEDRLPANLKGKVLIFFRFDCGSCHDTHDELMKLIQGYDGIYFVCSRSEQGSPLIDKYNVGEVPSAVYVPNGDDETPTVEPLSTTISSYGQGDRTAVDTERLDRILNLLKSQA